MSKTNKNTTKSGSRPGTGQNQSKKVSKKNNSASRNVKMSSPKGQRKSVAAAYSAGQVGRSARIVQTLDKCRIVHRELISSVTGSVAFTVQNSFALNPGLAATFPWLSTMAQSWEQYRFNKLRFCYYTRTGSTTPGSMMLAPDYDAADAPPSSEQIASSFSDTVEDAPWIMEMICNLPSSKLNGTQMKKFVRTAALAANLDIKTYDSGTMHVCTVDGTAVSWGKLWVEYDVEFFIPQLPSTGVLPQGGRVVGATAQTAANPFGTGPVVDPSALGLSMSATSIVTIAQPGTYVLSCVYSGTVITAIAAPVATGAIVNSTTTVFDAAAVTGAQVNSVTTTSANATFAFSLTATTVTAAVCTIGQAPPNSLS